MSKDKIKQKKDSVIMDVNDEYYDPDMSHNTGEVGVVVIKGGKPVLINSSSNNSEDTETQEISKSEIDDIIQTEVRTTQLPDFLDGDGEEKIVKNSKKNKSPKSIKRIETESVEPAEKRKRGRPKKV